MDNLYQSTYDSEAKDLENAESIQYKKTMLHRYLNDAIEVSNATACSRESEVLVSNKPESSKGQIISEGNCDVVLKFSLSKNTKLYKRTSAQPSKGGFFSESVIRFSNLQISKKIFQITILNLKFEIPAHNSKQLIQISSSG